MRCFDWRSFFLSCILGLTTNSIFLFYFWNKPSWASYVPLDRRCPQQQFNQYLTTLKNTVSVLDIPEEKYDDGIRRLAKERGAALLALSFCGAKAVPILRDELRRKNGYFATALTSIEHIGPEAEAATPEIVKFIYDVLDEPGSNNNDETWDQRDFWHKGWSLARYLKTLHAIAKAESIIVFDLLKRLEREKDDEKKIWIAATLDALGARSVAFFTISNLIKKSQKLREEATEALANMSASTNNASSLIKLLQDEEPCVSGRAALAFGRSGSSDINAIPYLQKTVMTSRDSKVKYNAALSLISIGLNADRSAISKALTQDVISAIMRDPYSSYANSMSAVHQECNPKEVYEGRIYIFDIFESLFIATSESKEPIASLEITIPTLINIAKDNRYSTRTRSLAVQLVGALGSTKAKSTVPELLKLFHKLPADSYTLYYDSDTQLSISIARTLGKFGEKSNSIPYLIDILKAPSIYRVNPDNYRAGESFEYSVHEAAAEGLGDIGLITVPYLLKEVRTLKSLQRRAVLYALYKISYKHKLPQNASYTLKDILKDKNNNINDRRIAAYALQASGVNINWFFSETGLLSLDHLTCLPDDLGQFYDDYYDIFSGKCLYVARGDGGPSLFYRIKSILFPDSKR